MSLIQALVGLGIPIVLMFLAGYGGYFALSLILGLKHNPVKIARFEAGNIPYGEGRLWYPLQYYGYLLIYTSIEPLVVILLLLAPSTSCSGSSPASVELAGPAAGEPEGA